MAVFPCILYTITMLVIWFKTIFSFSIYPLLRRVTPWRTAFFALYLWLMGVLVFNLYFAWQVHDKLPVFIRNFPTLNFEKGHLVSEEKAVIHIPSTDYAILLDSTRQSPPTAQEFADKHWLAFINDNQLYMLSVAGVSSQPIPAQVDGIIDAAWLQEHSSSIRGVLQTMIFMGSFFFLALFFFLSWLMAGSVILFWMGFNRHPMPLGIMTRWAIFLQGPALVLWIVNLLSGVPLFVLALFILFNIYVQQIFNILPDD